MLSTISPHIFRKPAVGQPGEQPTIRATWSASVWTLVNSLLLAFCDVLLSKDWRHRLMFLDVLCKRASSGRWKDKKKQQHYFMHLSLRMATGPTNAERQYHRATESNSPVQSQAGTFDQSTTVIYDKATDKISRSHKLIDLTSRLMYSNLP